MKNSRINIIFLCFLLFASGILTRLFFLQIIKGDFWRALAKGQQTIFKLENPERGSIFFQDKEGNLYLVATNKTEYFCYLLLNEISNKKREKVFEKLSKILNEKEISEQNIKEDKSFLILKEELTEDQIKKIKELNEEGVYVGERLERYYPQKTLASNTIGFVGGEEKGQYGIEGFYDEILRGEKGIVSGERDVSGFFTFLNLKDSILPQKGDDLVLTIDFFIQSMAEKLLEKAKEELEIEGGEIIVINPKTGEIKALSTLSKFDLNKYFEYEMERFKNSTIQSLFEPGSVFKPITMAGALDLGKITPETRYVDEGFVQVGGYKIFNYGKRVWGERTMTEVLEKSINTGAVFVEKKLGHKNFLEYIEKFGFFEKTGVDLQGEIFSENVEFKKGYEINFATASFGQGIQVTPLQLVRAFSAIANGGELITPHLVDKFIKKDGKIIKSDFPKKKKRIISKNTSKKLTEMLISVVEKGYGKRAKIPGYFIAGKTGTSQIPFSSLGIQKKGYSEKTWQSFIGYFPAFDPQFLILVKLDNPKTKTAEYSAAPIFHELAKYIINYWQIPPDYIIEEK